MAWSGQGLQAAALGPPAAHHRPPLAWPDASTGGATPLRGAVVVVLAPLAKRLHAESLNPDGRSGGRLGTETSASSTMR